LKGRQTVLILGAGASSDYGLPVGGVLLGQIYDLATGASKALLPHRDVLDIIGFGLSEARSMATNGADRPIPQLEPELRGFAKELKAFSARSIDQFLVRRREYADLGKLLIAI